MHRRASRAFTLIELIVVLVVLAALSGIVLPQIGGFWERGDGATGSANIREATSALRRYQTENFDRQPDMMDALIDAEGDLFFGLADAWEEDGFTAFEVNPLDSEEAEALNRGGARELVQMPSDGSATFFVGSEQPIISVEEGQELLFLDAEFVVAETSARDLDGTYVAFGIGTECSAIGRTLETAPMHFDDDFPPDELYGRFLAVSQVGDADGPLSRARLVGILGPEPAGLDAHLEFFYDSMR